MLPILLFQSKQVILEVLEDDVHHDVPILFARVIFNREYNGIKVCIFLTVRANLSDDFLKSDRAAEIHSL
jgi:hypothetical protein